MSLRLYEIADKYEFLLNDLYDEETGEIKNDTLAKLQELSAPLEEKCINVTRAFKAIEAERQAIEIERKNMAARERALKNQIEGLKEYLLTNMERCGVNKIECPQFVISLQKNPPSVEKYDESVIPKEYEKVTVEYDVAKMKFEMMNGVVIPGVRLVQKNSVRIR